ncbi:hypothetical protein C2E23DRAFT_343317 [Lenzites betulinus]|nr:hypothetical protein C2E23DRAFT_343317 [Lenzites betulinus]
MSTQCDFPRTATHPRAMDLHSSTTQDPRRPSHTTQPSSRRVPVPSASMPASSWLSDIGDFNPNPPSTTPDFLSVSIPTSGSLLGSGWQSDSGSPVRSSFRARPRDFISPTNTSPRASGSGSPSRHSPVPPAHTLHTSRSFSNPSPLRTSAFGERDASGHLDFKRLMSKPAKQTPSASSVVSVLSDSEHSMSASSSRYPASRRPSEPFIRPPPLKSSSSSRAQPSLHVNTTRLPLHSAPARLAQRSSPDHRPETSDGQPPKSSRNVLRRRPSTRSNPNTPTAAQFQVPAQDSLPPSRSMFPNPAPRDRLTSSQSARPATSSATMRASTLPRKTSAIAAATSKSSQYPGALTPAGAVALAYKQQEKRRSELAETASFNDAYRPLADNSSVISGLPMHPVGADPHTDDTDGEGGQPYYTVFGSPSGRLVAVGSPVDDDWHVSGWDPRAAPTGATKPSKPVSRSLSRKVSGSFKRVTESMKKDREPRDPVARTKCMEDWRPFDGSQSMGGRDSPAQRQVPRKPLPLDTNLEERSSPRASPVPKGRSPTKGHSPTKSYSPPKGSSPTGGRSPQEDGRGVRGSKAKAKEEATSSGMWSKLIKRISTGGLRDKYHQSDEPPPPVPALPSHLPKTPTSRTTMEISHIGNGEVSENGVLLRRFMQSRSSLSGVRPSIPSVKAASSSSSRPSTGTAGRPSTGNTTKSRASMGHRPVTATRSSSPVSSEMASSGFFNQNRSPSRSSFSSLGEELPPMPKNVGQYIVPPKELSRMTQAMEKGTSTPGKRSHKSSRSQSAPAEQRFEPRSPFSGLMPSLPIPPRRATDTVSPMNPSFSADDISIPANMSSSRSPALAEFGVQEPPPRPKRSSRRMPPANVNIPPRSQSMSATMPRSPATPRALPPTVRVDVDLARSPSTGALSYASTARQVPAVPMTLPASASPATSPSSGGSQLRSPLTFRELESPRQKLSEREKAAKWEDLLERSARAGGTLHIDIGDTGLLSEHPDVDGASVRGLGDE